MKVEDLKPAPGFVIVRPPKEVEKTEGGVYLAPGSKDAPQSGTVMAVCNDTDLKVGDEVYYKKWGGNEVEIGRVTYQFLRFEDILAVVK